MFNTNVAVCLTLSSSYHKMSTLTLTQYYRFVKYCMLPMHGIIWFHWRGDDYLAARTCTISGVDIACKVSIPSTDVIQLTLTLEMTTAQVVENVNHCQQQQSYSGQLSPGRSYSTYLWNDSSVQTFHKVRRICKFQLYHRNFSSSLSIFRVFVGVGESIVIYLDVC